MDENLIDQTVEEYDVTDDVKIEEINVPIEDIEQEILVEETTQSVIVEQEEEITVDISESMGWVSGDNRYHDSLLGVDGPNQHPITAITGLKEKLDNIEALKTVYADKTNIANFYEWKDAAYDEYGYFVSLVPGTLTIQICEGDDVFGVAVDEAGFIGGQGALLPRDSKYGIIVTSGLVDVRCELDVEVGDYVVSNRFGCATKTTSQGGYRVIAKEKIHGIEHAVIMLGVQADVTDKISKELQQLDQRVDDTETNVAAAMNLANEAYNKAEEIEEANADVCDKVEDAIGRVDGVVDDVENIKGQMGSVLVVSAQAKAIAESAVTSAESMKNEAAAKADEALADTSALRKEFEAKVAEIDTELDNTVSELDATKERFDTTIDDLRLDTEGQIADFKKEVADNYATTTQLAAVKTENSDAIAALKQEASDTYATIASVASLKTETSDALAGFKQEVSEEYATQEMLTSLETESSKALSDYKQEVTETYATQEMVSTLETNTSKALADYKQEVANDYATQEMVTKLETDTSKALSDYKQEVGSTYATNTSLATLKTETTNAIAASEEKATQTYASKSDLTTFESDTNIAMTRIEQKADANGASIQLLVANVDKYSVGPYSQAYGFTLEQARDVLEDGMVYVPTPHADADTHSEIYNHISVGPDGKETSSPYPDADGYQFTPGYIYTWTDIDPAEDKTTMMWKESVGEVVTFRSAPSGTAFDFWYKNSGDNSDGYELDTLYKLDTYTDENGNTLTRWIAVATLQGNANNRAVSQIRQDANSIEQSVSNMKGDVASSKLWIDDNSVNIQDVVSWKSDVEADVDSIATIKQTADDAGASIAQVVEAVGKNGEVNAASIVAAVNNAGSSVVINADHIQLDGVVSFVNSEVDRVQGNIDAVQDASVYEVRVEYALSSSDTSFIAVSGDDGQWSTTAPKWRGDTYMWQKTTIIKGDGAADGSSVPTCIQGAKGEDGYTPVLGKDYFNGTDGENGTSIVWKGSFSEAPNNPENGWAYYDTNAKASYTYQNGSWYQMSIDGVDGQDGKDGSNGRSIVWKGETSSAPANPQENWVYKDSDDGKVYIYTGSGWELMVLDGSDGQDGTNGSNGLSVFITYNDSSTTPSTPTGNGTANGWHTNATSASIWMSQKVAENANSGSWGAPIKIQGKDGKDGVGVSSTTVSYGTSTSATTQPTSWQLTMPNVTDGHYLWTRTITDYTDSSVADTVTYTYAKQGSKGDTGSPGTSVAVTSIQYQAGESSTTAPTGTWSNTIVSAAEGKYLWTKTTFSDGNVAYGVAKQGVSGKDGSGIKKVNTHVRSYPLAWWKEHADPECTDVNWTTGTSYDNSHIKQGDTIYIVGEASDVMSASGTAVIVTLYGVAQSITNTNVTIVPSHLITSGEKGDGGKDGVGVKSSTVTYGVSDSASVKPTSWGSSMPVIGENQYLWTCTVIDYTDASIPDTVTYTYAKQGAKGETGSPGTSVKVSSIQYQAGTSATVAPTGTWSDNVVSVNEGQYLWTKTTFSDGNVAYGVAKQGASGQKGDDAPKVTKVTKQYYLSSSSTSLEGGSWSNSPSNFIKGRYMWTRDVYSMSDGSTINGDPVIDKTFTTISGWCYANDTTVIDGANIATGTITAGQIAAYTITASEIASDAITADKIKAGEITADHVDVSGIISAGRADIETIVADKIDATEITADNVDVSGIITAGKADIETIVVDKIEATEIYVDMAHVTDLLNVDGKITADKIDANGISAKNANISGTLTAGNGSNIGPFYVSESTLSALAEDATFPTTLSADGLSCPEVIAESAIINGGSITASSGSLSGMTSMATESVTIDGSSISIDPGHDNVCYLNMSAGTDSAAISWSYASINFTTSGANLSGTWTAESCLGTASDERVKNGILPMSTDARYDAMFDALTPVVYKYNDGTSGRIHTGYIAQDVLAAVENAGLTSTDFAGYIKAKEIDQETGAETETCYLRYEEFIALNTDQIQKLKARVAELEKKIALLEQG